MGLVERKLNGLNFTFYIIISCVCFYREDGAESLQVCVLCVCVCVAYIYVVIKLQLCSAQMLAYFGVSTSVGFITTYE